MFVPDVLGWKYNSQPGDRLIISFQPLSLVSDVFCIRLSISSIEYVLTALVLTSGLHVLPLGSLEYGGTKLFRAKTGGEESGLTTWHDLLFPTLFQQVSRDSLLIESIQDLSCP